MSEPLSLYLHIPFCRHRCSYCDFNTYTTVGELRQAYTEALAREIGQAGRLAAGNGQRRPVRTIYFGGGTPSLLSSPQVATLLQSVARAFVVAADAEITLEANPGTLNQAYLRQLRALGINRLSLGAQSAVATELALLEREHDFEGVAAAVTMARTAGFDSISLDLLYGLPDQSLANWRFSLESALALQPDHLSCYCLTIEPGTPMDRWLRQGHIVAPDADLAADQYELARERLAAAGFDHYEISNWGRPGHQCRHNLVYWRDEEYLGLGAGAHGHAGGQRYHVVRQPRVYIRRMESGAAGPYPVTAAVAEHHTLSQSEAISDTLIMQLRLLLEGLDLAGFARRYGRSLMEVRGETISELVEWGLLSPGAGRLRLTRKGAFLSNQVFYRLIE